MSDMSSLGPDAAWYIQNIDRISAFRNYVTIVETDILPKRITSIVLNAARIAVEGIDSAFELDIGAKGRTMWWFVTRGYNPDTDIGAFVQVEIPEGGVEWLVDNDNYPSVSVYTYGGGGPKGKANSKRFSEIIGAQITAKLPRVKDFEEESQYYCLARRDLREQITVSTLSNPPALHKNLVKVFREFTLAVVPGLIALRKKMPLAG